MNSLVLFLIPLIVAFNARMYPLSKDLGFNNHSHGQEEVYKEIEFENTYRNYISGKGAVVAVIDTGCETTHEDLKENIAYAYNVITKDNNVCDIDGHGTNVAGIISASDNNVGLVGVAPDAKLCIIKTMRDGNNFFSYYDVIKAINKAVDLGYVNVINLSIGGYYDDDKLKEALNRAREKAGMDADQYIQ